MKTLLAALFVAVGLLAGCATATMPRGVSVNLVTIMPKSASLLETTADLTLRVTNESGAAMTFGGGSHRLYLNNMYVGRGVTNAGFALPGLTSVTQTFQVHIENLALFSELWKTSAPDPVVSYRIESEFPAGPGERFRPLRAVSSGKIDLGTFAAFKR